MSCALKPREVVYASFKYGAGEGIRNGRFFHDYTEERFKELLGMSLTLRLLDVNVTLDVRTTRADERWLNVLVGLVEQA